MLTFVVHARKTPEVLARVVLVFHGRRIEIDSLVAGHAERPDVLRIVIAVEGDQDRAALIEANLYRLADVLLVEKSDPHKETGPRVIEKGLRES